MEEEKKTRDKYFITVVVLGTLTVVVPSLFSNDRNVLVLALNAIVFILVMYTAFYVVPVIYKKTLNKISSFNRTREVKLEFAVVSANDKNFLLHVRNSGKRSVKNVKITWRGGLLVHPDFPNEP
ncbi:MAG: hypothetical protein EHM20_18360, partial [Alphaproteobacteria bacterium]